MHITVRYFAGQRDITGRQSEHLEVADESTLASVWQLLEERYPGLVPFRGRVLYAQNARFVPAETALNDGDTIAFIPPVSGGTFRPFIVTAQPLDPAPLVAHVSAPNVGAIVTFAGTARDHFGDRATARLEYEAYVEMAEQVLGDIAAEAIARAQTFRAGAAVRARGGLRARRARQTWWRGSGVQGKCGRLSPPAPRLRQSCGWFAARDNPPHPRAG